jgi:hypothetical protein
MIIRLLHHFCAPWATAYMSSSPNLIFRRPVPVDAEKDFAAIPLSPEWTSVGEAMAAETARKLHLLKRCGRQCECPPRPF